jgi:hypothetical protein
VVKVLHHEKYEAIHKSASPRGHHKASVDWPASSTLHPGSSCFRLPSFKPIEWRNPRKEFWGRRGSHFRSKELVATERCRVIPRMHTGSHILVA